MRYLFFDTSSEQGIALLFDLASKDLQALPFPEGFNHSRKLVQAIEQLINPYRLEEFPVSAIGIGVGPGSYTGIRIGAAVAEGLAYAWNIPLIPLSSLQIYMPPHEGHFAVILDARIGGFYYQKGCLQGDKLIYEGLPQVASLEACLEVLKEVDFVITPHLQKLQSKKILQAIPAYSVIPSPLACKEALLLHPPYAWKAKMPLELYYLRKVQAEIEQSRVET